MSSRVTELVVSLSKLRNSLTNARYVHPISKSKANQSLLMSDIRSSLTGQVGFFRGGLIKLTSAPSSSLLKCHFMLSRLEIPEVISQNGNGNCTRRSSPHRASETFTELTIERVEA